MTPSEQTQRDLRSIIDTLSQRIDELTEELAKISTSAAEELESLKDLRARTERALGVNSRVY